MTLIYSKRILTRISLLILLAILQCGRAQINVSSTTAAPNSTQVPVLDFKQVVEIANGTTTTTTQAPPTTTTTTTTTTKAPPPTTTTTKVTTPSTTPTTTRQPTTVPISTSTRTTQSQSSSSVSTSATKSQTTTKVTTKAPTPAATSATTIVTSTPVRTNPPVKTQPTTRATTRATTTKPTTKPTTTSTTTEATTTTPAPTTVPTTTVELLKATVIKEVQETTTSLPETTAAKATENQAAPANLIKNVYGVVQSALKENPTKPPTTTSTTTTTTAATTKRPEPLKLSQMTVKIAQGELRPAIHRSRGGRKYFAFRGVPYAIPPVYNLRFKDTDIVAPWSGVLNASTYGPSCIQYNILTEEIEGEEDCLHLNIFTPKVPLGRMKKKSERYPVMVFFHQGAFMFGTSKDFEEKYMMDEDVVLVTVNYRLSVFGFLNTQGDSDAKGNQGLKDQVLALKFIRENIHHFNGEPNLVTIFGESAGASSVHYHLLSQRSRGLFQRGISMSGTALSPWAFTRSPRKMAKKLGTFLNCPTSDMSELFGCLQGHDARIIAEKTKDLYVWNTDPITSFGPSIEVEDSLSAFITQSPYSLMKSGQIADVPWILGVVEDVCLLDSWSILVNPQLVDDMRLDWHRIAPATFMYKETALEPDAVSNQVKAYYFGNQEVGNNTARNLSNLYSDRYFNHGIRTSALMHVRQNEATQVYLYMFSYKGTQSHTKFAGISENLGVSEGDDLRYLFNTGRFDDIPLDSKDGDISQKFVKLWVSFAREGKPTALWGGSPEWKRITADQLTGDEALMYYNLNEQCGFIEEPFSARLNFWDTLPLNENGNELFSSLYNNQHGEDDDLFDRFN